MAVNLSYEQVLDLIAKQYNTKVSDVVTTLNNLNIDITDVNETFKLLEDTPYKILYNSDGTTRAITYQDVSSTTNSAGSVAGNIDSNVSVDTSVKTNIPLNTSNVSGKASIKAGLKTAGKFVVGSVVPAIAATSVGITLGKTIDKILYSFNPDFWDSHGMASLNPDTWDSITLGDDSINARLFNIIFGIDSETGVTQGYIDQNALAYLALYMQNAGIFGGEVEYTPNDWLINKYPDSTFNIYVGEGTKISSSGVKVYPIITNNTNTVYRGFVPLNSELKTLALASLSPFTYTNSINSSLNWKSKHTTVNGMDVYYGGVELSYYGTEGFNPTVSSINGQVLEIGVYAVWAYVVLYGASHSNIPGVADQPNAKFPDLTTATDPESALTLLKQQYPELWEKAVTNTVPQPDGSLKEYVYVPVAMPQATSAVDMQPVSSTATQAKPEVSDATTPSLLPLVKDLLAPKATNKDIDTTTNTGTGASPTVVAPVGTPTSLYKIYNPSASEVDSFGAWLWSNSFVDQILKIFSDPMQAVIGLHKVYTPVNVGGRANIKVGYLDSGVNSNYVSNQYVTIDCGTVNLSELYGNVLDYGPYTNIHIYLPFIGIQQLNTGDVMRGKINVTYQCDVLSGACIANISVIRDMSGGILYTYSGNCAVQMPISSGSYLGVVAGVASVAAGIAGTLGSGGAALSTLAMGANRLLGASSNVSHSGGFSGNAGALGNKKPYLIISRAQSVFANNFPAYFGKPANYTVRLGDCQGFVRISECHLESIPATSGELSEIDSLLKSGIII